VNYLLQRKYLTKSVFLLLLGNLLLGVSYIAMLPIWEGFDETSHFSYLQLVADNRKLPLDRKDPISSDVEKYYAYAPMPNALSSNLKPKDRLTYQSFFLKPDKFLSRSQEFIHSTHNHPRKYLPGQGYSWESQHPPLYYILLSPVYLITNTLSWSKQIFFLRTISYFLAWLGLVLGALGCLDMARSQNTIEKVRLWNWAAIGCGLWPVFFPGWFSDTARLGNDSVCTLLIALTWIICLRIMRRGVSMKYFLLMGFVLGLGCLTKAFFVPISIGVLAFWIFRQRKISGRSGLKQAIGFSSLTLILILILSSWWYWNNLVQYGVFLGSNEMIWLDQAGGMWEGLKKNFSLYQWIRGHSVVLVTFAFIGSWSSPKPPWIFLFPIGVSVLGVTSFYLWTIRRYIKTSEEWFPVWLSIPLLVGLSYHVLIRIGLTGEGRGTGGYFLNILAAPLASALGISLCGIWGRRLLRAITQIYLGYIILFSIGITWIQSLFFSGIVSTSESEKTYLFPEQLPSFFGLNLAYERLQILVYPDVGLLLLVVGWGIVLIGLSLARRYAYQSS
jgi:hypothetical protein